MPARMWRAACRLLDRLRDRGRSTGREAAALVVGFTALVTWGLATGPAEAVPAGAPCALVRTTARHSEGLDSWNPAYRRPLGDIDAVMVFLAFPDHVPAVRPRVLAADHFPGTTEYFARASYGRLRLHPHLLPHWLRMPRPSTAYRIRRDWDAGPRARYLRDAIAAAAGTVDFRRYPVVYLVADPDAPGIDSDATKVVSLGRPLHAHGAAIRHIVTVFERHPADRDVLAHETNHVFDLPDLYLRPPPGSHADWDTRVGDWDLMGSQFGSAPGLFAWHRWKYGWLDRSQVACLDHPGTVTRALSPVETPGGPKLIVVRTGLTAGLAIEARRALGNDRLACTEGVLLYRVRTTVDSGTGPITVLDGHPRTAACRGSSVYPPLADAPLRSGETYTYRFGRSVHDEVRVHVLGRDRGGGWTVTVDER